MTSLLFIVYSNIELAQSAKSRETQKSVADKHKPFNED